MPLHRGSPRNEKEREARELVADILKDSKRLAELVEESAQSEKRMALIREFLDTPDGGKE